MLFRSKDFKKYPNSFYAPIILIWSLLIIFNKNLLNLTQPLSIILVFLIFLTTKNRILINKLTNFLGKYSFSLYVSHWIALTLLSKLIQMNSLILFYFFGGIFSIMFAFIFAKLVEFPAQKIARNLIK